MGRWAESSTPCWVGFCGEAPFHKRRSRLSLQIRPMVLEFRSDRNKNCSGVGCGGCSLRFGWRAYQLSRDPWFTYGHITQAKFQLVGLYPMYFPSNGPWPMADWTSHWTREKQTQSLPETIDPQWLGTNQASAGGEKHSALPKRRTNSCIWRLGGFG